MTRPTVLTMDQHDTRKELLRALLVGLHPVKRAVFLDWCCEFARFTSPVGHLAPLAFARADHAKMGPKIREALKGDPTADLWLANEVYADVAHLCHQWGADFLTILTELENWAKGREPRPVWAAAGRPAPARATPPPARR